MRVGIIAISLFRIGIVRCLIFNAMVCFELFAFEVIEKPIAVIVLHLPAYEYKPCTVAYASFLRIFCAPSEISNYE